MAAIRKTYVVDSRLPVSPNTSESDPTHPRMITRNILMVQNQAVADRKYDIVTPARIFEGFAPAAVMTDPRWKFAIGVGIVFAILYVILRVQHQSVQIALAICAILVLHSMVLLLDSQAQGL